MLKLNVNEICPHSTRCPHNVGVEMCMGANSNRSTEFSCNFVNDKGQISESGFRNPQDQTGNQTILRE